MIIAISGKAQSGKDTICKMIQYCITYYKSSVPSTYPFGLKDYEKSLDSSLERMSRLFTFRFAELLKDSIAAILGCGRRRLEDINFKNSEISWILEDSKPITVRRFMQRFGTALRREFSEYFWADSVLRYRELGDMIIPDLRYKTELEAIKNKDPENIIIRVNRPGVQLMDHPSETELDDYEGWDYVIENDGTLEDLLYKVKDFCKKFNLI